MSQKYSKDSLGTRMKEYEHVSKTTLTKRTPVIIRLDGKAFHTWTKCLKHVDPSLEQDPFSDVMNQTMAITTEKLVANIQNAVLGYTQSDEISILLNDWSTLTTDQWFGNNVQKIVSVAASMATAYFNQTFAHLVGTDATKEAAPALFDARVWNLPKEEVTNYFVWRQQDATRNSINMLAQHYFSHKELHGKNVSQVQDMLMLTHGVNWNDIETWKKRGTCVTRRELETAPNREIRIDREIPIFTGDRSYVEQSLEAVEA